MIGIICELIDRVYLHVHVCVHQNTFYAILTAKQSHNAAKSDVLESQEAVINEETIETYKNILKEGEIQCTFDPTREKTHRGEKYFLELCLSPKR